MYQITVNKLFAETEKAIALHIKPYGECGPMGYMWMPKNDVKIVRKNGTVQITVPAWRVDEYNHNDIDAICIEKI